MSDEKNTSGPEESGLKEKLWDVHPIVMATAKIPTRPILKTYALIKKRARRGRRSIAFYAQPLRGKTTSITVLKALIQRDFPGCGIYEYRVGSKDGIDKPKDGRQVRAVISKGGFYESLIHALDEDLKLENSVERKKEQFCRALYARSVTTRRLFIFLDEAQALVAAELGWLKDVVNDLVGSEICVTVVLFGQEELKQQFESLKSNLRSDLLERFIQDIYEFEGITDEEELRLFLHACDAGSEFPSGSGLSYSQFLWPTAYAGGFRLASCAHDFWQAIQFARKVIETRGQVSDADLKAVRDSGYSEANIIEIVALVAMYSLTNFFNNVFDLEKDFPAVAPAGTI